jgi:hypothetical protein
VVSGFDEQVVLIGIRAEEVTVDLTRPGHSICTCRQGQRKAEF